MVGGVIGPAEPQPIRVGMWSQHAIMRRRSTACWLPLIWCCMAVAALAYYEPALPQPPPQPKWSDALRDAAAMYKGENKFDLYEFTGE